MKKEQNEVQSDRAMQFWNTLSQIQDHDNMRVQVEVNPLVSRNDDNLNFWPEQGIRDIATGWVELQHSIKFPIRLRTYTNPENGRQDIFVNYPQKKGKDNKYSAIVDANPMLREEITQETIRQFCEKFWIESPGIKVKQLTVLNADAEKEVRLCALASVEVGRYLYLSDDVERNKITIHGIAVKEGRNGLFVEMPQHLSGGKYRDTVYGSTKEMQQRIREDVLIAYQRKLEALKEPAEEQETEESKKEETAEPLKQQEDEKQKEIMDSFREAYSSMAPVAMYEALRKMEWKQTVLNFHEDSKVALQTMETVAGNNRIQLSLDNSGTEKKIVGVIYQKDASGQEQNLGTFDLLNMLIRSPEDRADYEVAIDAWQHITGQSKTVAPDLGAVRTPAKTVKAMPKL